MSDWSLYWKHHPKQASARKSSAYSSLLGKVGMMCAPKAKAKVELTMREAEPEHKLDHPTGALGDSATGALKNAQTLKFELYRSELEDKLKAGSITERDF